MSITFGHSDWRSSLEKALIFQIDAPAVKAALLDLSGELKSTLPVVLIGESRFLREVINNRLREATKAICSDTASGAFGNTDATPSIAVWSRRQEVFTAVG
ncbi:hypothetical protein [Ochrobactrum sp. Marseille-Q0166]|uniref:hypothetical protein n=1 Tax=Ochrobactrum sp. Marseille-Q0166 TaxID=2761105 RepID=UPI001655AD56|nr:hypothetical protein [Ochrobactrum sp. Marseille-Q0166]MBC8719602.1 hypothetical protein [Ochrobactrum sp. Marseille-Q0166]